MDTLGNMIDNLKALKEEKKEIEEQLRQKVGEILAAEEELMDAMDAQGVKKSTGECATASISTTTVPNVENWDAFYEYIHENRFYHLLERRPSAVACRELFETKGFIPGVIPFNKRRLNVRAA